MRVFQKGAIVSVPYGLRCSEISPLGYEQNVVVQGLEPCFPHTKLYIFAACSKTAMSHLEPSSRHEQMRPHAGRPLASRKLVRPHVFATPSRPVGLTNVSHPLL